MPAIITFTKVALPYGFFGNMSPHPVRFNGRTWRTTEALFQAMRFANFSDDVAMDVYEGIWKQASPMAAKLVAKKHKSLMVVEPGSELDRDNMRRCLKLKVDQHLDVRQALLDTGDAEIIEDCSKRGASIWGAQLRDGQWIGENLLGRFWMDLREELRCTRSAAELAMDIFRNYVTDPHKFSVTASRLGPKLQIAFGLTTSLDIRTFDLDLNKPEDIQRLCAAAWELDPFEESTWNDPKGRPSSDPGSEVAQKYQSELAGG